MAENTSLQNAIANLVRNYSIIGMTWHDVLLVASQQHEKKIHEILGSTLNGNSLQDLVSIIELAKREISPPVPAEPEPKRKKK